MNRPQRILVAVTGASGMLYLRAFLNQCVRQQGLEVHGICSESGAKVPERPVLFVKGINTLQNPGDPILVPQFLRSDEVDYECELAVVIGKAGKNIPRARALDHVLGYTCANDVSARDHQIKLGGGQWCRGKFFDTFAPLGPCLVTPEDIPNPNALKLATILNGKRVQDWTTSDMIFDVPTIIEYL
ncbi:MAG: fumarylacetoacetate hydrolase family protein, partial [Desulfofustis sp.]|nr:fumarylacetoacetate hydrolase family protein [Desulfofustis sp.]